MMPRLDDERGLRVVDVYLNCYHLKMQLFGCLDLRPEVWVSDWILLVVEIVFQQLLVYRVAYEMLILYLM